MERAIRILIAKPGLDGHDRGAKVIAYALRDAGMEVIYTGLRRSTDEIIAAALQEDVDAIGLSILSGAHLALTEKIVSALHTAGLDEIAVFVGGTIPPRDVEPLTQRGAAGVFPTGTPLNAIAPVIRDAVAARRSAQTQ
ncbi:MAG TPA: cobalamin B12-binding domain-containing protein [Candidatus Binataceae bacterium]|jgi:methylmalonyl-CoA mutase C-terminal domain/subunit|nr:cobalamin B12-binding domain-containing protein [Candidatus Binataceae bacterium]